MDRASCWQEHRAEEVLPHLPDLKLRKAGRGHGEDILKDALQVGSNIPSVFSTFSPKNHRTDNLHPNYNQQKYRLHNIWKLKHTRFVLLSNNNTWIHTSPQFFDILIYFGKAFSSKPPHCFCWMSISEYSKHVSYCFKHFTYCNF